MGVIVRINIRKQIIPEISRDDVLKNVRWFSIPSLRVILVLRDLRWRSPSALLSEMAGEAWRVIAAPLMTSQLSLGSVEI